MKQTPKLLVLKGLSASGKTTYAKELEKKGWIRVEKDEIRKDAYTFPNGYRYPQDESRVVQERDKMIRTALRDGLDVVSSDTNLNPVHIRQLQAIARQLGADFSIDDSFLATPLAELIERDKNRDNSVGEQVIRDQFHKNHIKLPTFHKWQEGLPMVVWVDIDGTLTDKSSLKKRSPYDYRKVLGDDPNLFTMALVDGLSIIGYAKIFIFSGREDSCRADTEAWLEKHDVEYDKLVMRKTGDNRPDDVIKYEMFQEHIEGQYNCLGVLDDRMRVSMMARDVLGLNVAQFGDTRYTF